MGLAHLASLGALVFAETRSLTPGPHRGERIFIAAMFPPALLRTPSEWLSEQCVAFHPATVAAAVLDSETFTELVRREIAELDHPSWQRHGGSETPCAAERRKSSSLVRAGVLSLLLQRDKNSTGLAPRHPVDADAKSYCPLCLGDFRSDFRYCTPCGVATVAYERIASAGERAAPASRSVRAEGHS